MLSGLLNVASAKPSSQLAEACRRQLTGKAEASAPSGLDRGQSARNRLYDPQCTKFADGLRTEAVLGEHLICVLS